MSSPTNPSNSFLNSSQTSEVRIVFPRRLAQSNHKSAHVVISSCIYWKAVNQGAASGRPLLLIDFRRATRLELIRLKQGTWKEVNEVVKVGAYEGRPCITVRGRLHSRKRRDKPFIAPDVEIEIIANTLEQHEVWVNKIRARIAPWNLVQQAMRDAASLAPASGVVEPQKARSRLAYAIVGTKPSSMLPDKVEENWGDILSTLPEHMQKLTTVDELTTHGAAVVETGATLTKLVRSVECVAETAEVIADASKCVAGVSTVFRLVGLCAQAVSMCVEANRGRRVLPVALGQITVLLRYLMGSLAEIIKPSCSVDETAFDFVFDALKETVCIMDVAETQLLRGRISQIVNAESVKKVEQKIEHLKQMAVIADNTSKICVLGEKLNRLEKGERIRGDRPHHVRPSVSAFFSGRKKELKTLQGILEKRGSAVITQYGGVGKTELMIAFADQAEQDAQVPGGVFWVTVDGGGRDVIVSLAGLAEKLTRRRMEEEERRNAHIVIESLKQGLNERQGRWLLCLDNADDIQVRGILNEVCAIAEPSRGNGWVVVTSRQGQPHIWERMKSEQKLVLAPLCAEDAMVTLWRQIRKIETVDADDGEVLTEIKKMKCENHAEFCALKKLCGDDEGRGLGGLPLALVQAGSFIAQFEYSFVEYLNLFESSTKEDWEEVMNKTEDFKSIQDSQRSIWTTWKISVEKLSGNAYMVLRSMAMLGQGGIGEAMVKGILGSVAAAVGGSTEGLFRKVIVKELMHGSSLLSNDEAEGDERRVYSMHRLVRRFILNDMGPGSDLWNKVYYLALPPVCEGVKSELEKEGKSFRALPDVFGNNYHEFAAHSMALVYHHVLPAKEKEVRNISLVDGIHEFCGKIMEFLGKSEEEVHVWDRLRTVLEHQQAVNRSRSNIEGLLGMLYREYVGKHGQRRIAAVCDSLGCALMRTGRLNNAVSKLEQSLELKQKIHGYGTPHSSIANCLNNLGLAYKSLGNLDKALEKLEQSLEMYRAVFGKDKPHPQIATSLNNLGNVYRRMDKLDKALEKHKESLKMRRAIYGYGKPHPHIASSLNNLGTMYLRMRKLEKALEMHEQSLEMSRAIHGHSKLHPYIASSLGNLGSVYEAMGNLDKALEMHGQSLEMSRAIHGNDKAHPVIGVSLLNIGLVHYRLNNQNQADDFFKRGFEMLQIVHGRSSQDVDIETELMSAYIESFRWDEALAKHERDTDTDKARDNEM